MLSMLRLLPWFCLCLPALGCGLIPIPYAVDVAGPVRGVRVLDMRTGHDIPTATASIASGMGMTGASGAVPPQLFASTPEPGEEKKEKPAESDVLKRDKNETFTVPRCVVAGMIARGYLHEYPPAASIEVSAPGYVRATLEYCVADTLKPGWSQTRARLKQWTPPADDSSDAAGEQRETDAAEDLVRCQLGEDGVLQFMLHAADNGQQ
jgi:hypothetical protein